MKIAIACDHGGYLLKQDILIWLEENDIDYEDFGCYTTESVAYPVLAERAASKVKGIRCALCTDSLQAEMTRRHNDANMMALGAGITGGNLAKRMVEIFLHTEFEGGRHARRVALLDAIQ